MAILFKLVILKNYTSMPKANSVPAQKSPKNKVGSTGMSYQKANLSFLNFLISPIDSILNNAIIKLFD